VQRGRFEPTALKKEAATKEMGPRIIQPIGKKLFVAMPRVELGSDLEREGQSGIAWGFGGTSPKNGVR